MLPLLLGLVLGVLVLAGCGGDDETAGSATTGADTVVTSGTTEGGGDAIKVGLVTDIGGLDDRSFNFLANKGLERAEEELGVEGRVVISRANADYVPNLSSLAKPGLRPRDRRRLPDGRRARHGREAVPGR